MVMITIALVAYGALTLLMTLGLCFAAKRPMPGPTCLDLTADFQNKRSGRRAPGQIKQEPKAWAFGA